MVIYHGSENKIEKPEFRGSRPRNDYGYGFYCTEYPDVAREWSVGDDHDGYINSYEFSMEGLRVLDLNGEPILSWLYVLLDNRVFSTDTPLASEAKRYIQREFGLDYEKYDVITGYRADDSYFSYAQDFINNGITVDQLKTAMHLGDLGDQIVLKSRKAFKQIEFLGAEKVLRNPWLNRKRIVMTRQEKPTSRRIGCLMFRVEFM